MGGFGTIAHAATLALAVASPAWGSSNADCRDIVAAFAELYDMDAVYATVFDRAPRTLLADAAALRKNPAAQRELLVRTFLEAADSPTHWLAAYENTPDPVTRRKRTPAELRLARDLVAYLAERFPPPEADHYRRPFPAKVTPSEKKVQTAVLPLLREEKEEAARARRERAARYLGKRVFKDDAEFDRWVESAAYRKYVAEVRALSADELPWLSADALQGKSSLDFRSPLVDRGGNHKGIFESRLDGREVVVKRAPLAALAHELRLYLLLNKLGMGPTAYGLVELEPGQYAIVLEKLAPGADSKALFRARGGVFLARQSGVPLGPDTAGRVRRIALRMEAGGLGTAEDFQLRFGNDGSIEPIDVEGVANGVVHAYGQRLPSPAEAVEPLVRLLEAAFPKEAPSQRPLEVSKSR